MKPIQEVGGQVLTWTWRWTWSKPVFEILSGDDLVGTIHLYWKQAVSNMDVLTLAESADRRWIFKWRWRNPLKRPLEIFTAESGSPIATYRLLTGEPELGFYTRNEKGTLVFPDGHRFLWNPGSGACEWRHSHLSTKLLLRFIPKYRIFFWYYYPSGRIEISSDAFSIPEFPLLVLFGCYRCVIRGYSGPDVFARRSKEEGGG